MDLATTHSGPPLRIDHVEDRGDEREPKTSELVDIASSNQRCVFSDQVSTRVEPTTTANAAAV